MSKAKEFTITLSESEAGLLKLYTESNMSAGLAQARGLLDSGRKLKADAIAQCEAHVSLARKLKKLPDM